MCAGVAGVSGVPDAGAGPRSLGLTLSPLTGGELLALAMSLRVRGLRGLDVLRRSQNRAPPGVC
jgi:hypothetical protein